MTGDSIYRRLPGRSGLFIRHSLWIASDHLLRVRAHPFAQEYRRYYFKDVQALVLTEIQNSAAYFLYGFAALLAFNCALLFTSGHPVWGVLLALPTLLLLYLAWRIPDCACRIQTRVSTDWVPSLGKLSQAHNALVDIQAAVEQTQGRLEQQILPSPVPVEKLPPADRARPVLSHSSGVAHWILFALLLVRGIQTLVTVAFTVKSVPFSLLGDAISTAAFVTAIAAALLQLRADLARRVQWMVYASLVWQVLSFGGSLGLVGYVGVRLALKQYSAASDFQSAGRLFQFVDASAYLLLAFAGMILLWLHQRAVHTPPPLAEDEPVTTLEPQ